MNKSSVKLPGPESMHDRSYDTLEVVRLDDRAFIYLYTEGQPEEAAMLALPDLHLLKLVAVACKGFNTETVLICLSSHT